MDDVLNTLIQCAVDLGIPLDKVPTSSYDVAYLQACLQWVIFVVTIFFGTCNNLVKSSMGAVR
jgi:hypothetical protein